MFMGKAQLVELGLKNLLADKYGYEEERIERWTLGRGVKELQERGLRPDFIVLLEELKEHRNYIAHEMLLVYVLLRKLAGNVPIASHGSRFTGACIWWSRRLSCTIFFTAIDGMLTVPGCSHSMTSSARARSVGGTVSRGRGRPLGDRQYSCRKVTLSGFRHRRNVSLCVMTEPKNAILEAENADLRNLLAQAGLDAARLLAKAGIDATENEAAKQLQRLLLEELHHRVKNTLATVIAITSQSLRTAETLDEGRLAVENRLMALGSGHDLLLAANWAGADLSMIVKSAIEPFGGHELHGSSCRMMRGSKWPCRSVAVHAVDK